MGQPVETWEDIKEVTETVDTDATTTTEEEK